MRLSPNQKSLLKELEVIKSQINFGREIQGRLRAQNQREQKVASRYRQRLFERGMRAVGIDLAEIEARQNKANAQRDRGSAKIAQELGRNAKQVKSRQSDWYRRIAALHMRKTPAPQFDAAGINQTASTVVLTDEGDPKDAVTSLAPGANEVHFAWDFSVSPFYENWEVVDVTFNFFLTPEQSGLLSVAVPIVFNGSLWGNIYGSCAPTFDVPGAGLQSYVTVMVLENQGKKRIIDVAKISTPQYLGAVSSCHGGQFATPIDDTLIVETTPLEVVAELPVVVAVAVYVQGHYSCGRFITDFSSGAQGINVPGVLFGIK